MNCSSPWLFSSNHGHIIPNVAAIGKVGSQSAYDQLLTNSGVFAPLEQDKQKEANHVTD
jgi:hypothetical protein